MVLVETRTSVETSSWFQETAQLIIQEVEDIRLVRENAGQPNQGLRYNPDVPVALKSSEVYPPGVGSTPVFLLARLTETEGIQLAPLPGANNLFEARKTARLIRLGQLDSLLPEV